MAAAVIERSAGSRRSRTSLPATPPSWGSSPSSSAPTRKAWNVLAVTGDPPHVGDYPGSSGVYDVDAIGLVSLLAHLNRGEDFSGKAIDAPTSFYVAVAVNPSADDLEREVERFREKVDAGARFAMTQACSTSATSIVPRRLGGESPIPFLVGIWPLTSFQLAFRLHNEVRGSRSPSRCRSGSPRRARTPGRSASSRAAPRRGARSRAAGIYVIPPFQRACRGP